MTTSSWTHAELRAQLAQFERDLRAAGLTESTVHTYVDRSERFLRYLVGEYRPRR
jgi:hypothetical protein